MPALETQTPQPTRDKKRITVPKRKVRLQRWCRTPCHQSRHNAKNRNSNRGQQDGIRSPQPLKKTNTDKTRDGVRAQTTCSKTKRQKPQPTTDNRRIFTVHNRQQTDFYGPQDSVPTLPSFNIALIATAGRSE